MRECVIDTTVLQKANAPLDNPPRQNRLFVRRLRLLQSIQDGTRTVLISRQLLQEYLRQVRERRNEYVRAFFELILDPWRRSMNWEKRWSRGRRGKARECRYPQEDDHVLRTAIRPSATVIFTEEERMLKADACIYRQFNVHIWPPPEGN